MNRILATSAPTAPAAVVSSSVVLVSIISLVLMDGGPA